jgi:hypothetical protein
MHLQKISFYFHFLREMKKKRQRATNKMERGNPLNAIEDGMRSSDFGSFRKLVPLKRQKLGLVSTSQRIRMSGWSKEILESVPRRSCWQQRAEETDQ